MKKIILLICTILITLGANAQVISDGKTDGQYEEVINCNLSKSQLWSNLKRWVAVTFVSYKHTVDMEDKESGTMVVKYSVAEKATGVYVTSVTSAILQVDVKDKKYRVTISAPSFEIKPSKLGSGDLSLLPNSIQEEAQAELQAASYLSESGLGSYEALLSAIETYTTIKDRTPKFKSPEDEEEGKINPAYKVCEKTTNLGNMIKTLYYFGKSGIVKSLKKGMAYSNDF